MKTARWVRRSVAVLGSLMLSMVAVVALTSTAALAETPVARLVMYEVTEALRFKPGTATDPAEFKRRMASASLLGVDVTPLASGVPFAAGQFVVANATSNVNLHTLRGPVQGSIDILTDLDPSRNSLDTLVITSVLRIQAELDLSPTATVPPTPLALIDGTWRIKDTDYRGHFTGFFAIPFQIPGGGDQYYYLDMGPGSGSCAQGSVAAGGVCTVTPEEFVLGIPLTKAVIVLSDRP